MFSNHQKKVEERFKQLKTLNDAIDERNSNIASLDNEINRLKTILSTFKSEHPGLSEVDAALKELENITSQITTAKIELAKIKEEHDLIGDIIAIKTQKSALEEELASLQKQKTDYDPEDVIIVAYTVPNIDDVAIDAFVFKETSKYDNSYGNECTGKVYQSLGGGRTIGIDATYDGYLSNDRLPKYNAVPKKFVTFEEACLAIGSDLYLKDKVTAKEIHDILMYFRSGFYFYGKTDITLDEFMEMIKTERKDLANKPLQKLLEKGKTK